MTKFIPLFLALLTITATPAFAFNTYAKPKNYLTKTSMKMINLEGRLSVMNMDTGETQFNSKITKALGISKASVRYITDAADSEAVSAIYETRRKNVYVYVGLLRADDVSKAKFALNIVIHKNNALSAISYPIRGANVRSLTLAAGSSHEPETAVAALENGTFFPF